MRFKVLLLCFSASLCFSQNSWKAEDLLVFNDSIKLPGTLSYQNGIEGQTLLIFVPGSGNPDRNGNQPQLGINGNYIKQLAKAMNTAGFAFFSYDKRNVTKENIPMILRSYEFTDLVDDVKAILEKFKDDQRFAKIVLIGHSQGSLVAMMAVNDQVAKYVSLAGLGESADKAIIRQISAQSEELGQIAKAHIEELKKTGSIATVSPMLAALFAKQNHQFLRSYFYRDPAVEIQKLDIPVLIVNGTKDIQVEVRDARLLKEAKMDAKLKVVENMNHVLKDIVIDSDNLKSYYSPDYPLSKSLLKELISFINE